MFNVNNSNVKINIHKNKNIFTVTKSIKRDPCD